MSKSQTHLSKGIVQSTDAPRTAIRDAVLANASANVDGEAVIDGLLWLVESDARAAAISGPGRMVGFHEYSEVRV